MADRVGQQLGNYTLVRLLGRGGQAEVYLGEHRYLKSFAALKVLHASLDDKHSEQFLAEAQTLARLVHPSIVRVLDFTVEQGMPVLVMDYAPEGTIRQRYPVGTCLPLGTVVSAVSQVASALHYAHTHHVIHRDVKPENLLLGPRGEVLLSDFGLSVFAPSPDLLSTQAMAGTLPYMAPEQLQGHPCFASDQYSLAIIAYEWLTGRRPFTGSPWQLIQQHVEAAPPPLRQLNPSVSLEVEAVVLKALAKDPRQRFVQIQDFAQALEEASREEVSGQTLPVLIWGDPTQVGRRAASMGQLPRGTVTLLFSDMEGSTSLLHQLGERYTAVLGECRRLLRAAFHRWQGHEVDTQGDSFFVVFARATDALAAAVDAQRALAGQSWPDGISVRVRMGVHTGEPQLSAQGYVGLDVHRVARIMSAGHGGQVLLSQTTRDLVEHDLPEGVSLRDLGAHRLKDFPQKSQLFQLVIAGLQASFPSLKTLDTRPHNLPVQLTPFIGREKEVALVQNLLCREEVRLFTITGPGGIGKTRLGLQVAAELSDGFPDGVYFVNLAPISQPTFVLSTIAQTLQIKESGAQSFLDLLKAFLHEKHVLLLLDNFEQVISAAVQVADLLAACPKLKVIVTSREILHLRGEQEFAVPPLSLPDPRNLPDLAALSQYEAVALFIHRAQAARPEFQLTTANAPAIAEICVRLDGLPLALELAAARLKVLSPQQLLARLCARLAVLTSETAALPARQETLRQTIAWSYDLLDAREQRLFQHLSVFAGGCTLEALEAVEGALSEATGQVLDTVASLIDKSLVQSLEQPDQLGQAPRLWLLETVQEYGLECLASSGEWERTRQVYALYYLSLAEEAEPELDGPRQASWLGRLGREYENLRVAMQWSLEQGKAGQDQEMALRLGRALIRLWQIRGPYREGRAFLEQALEGSAAVEACVRAKALLAMAQLLFEPKDADRCEAYAKESLVLYQELGDKAGIATCLNQLASAAAGRYNLSVARPLVKEALALHREVGNKRGIAHSLRQWGWWALQEGDYVTARSLLEESLALYTELGDTSAIAGISRTLARLLLASQSELQTARALLEESLVLGREVGDKSVTGDALAQLGHLALWKGDHVTAHHLYEQSLALAREGEDRDGMGWALFWLAGVEASQEDYRQARALCEESLAVAREIGDKWMIANNLERLGYVAMAQGEPVWAQALRQSFGVWLPPIRHAACRRWLAAVRLWGEAAALREAIGLPLEGNERALHEWGVETARTSLGKKAFTAAWDEGHSMVPEYVPAAPKQAGMFKLIPVGPPLVPPTRSLPTYTAPATAWWPVVKALGIWVAYITLMIGVIFNTLLFQPSISIAELVRYPIVLGSIWMIGRFIFFYSKARRKAEKSQAPLQRDHE